VILLHGMFGGVADWGAVRRHFAQELPVHAPRLPVFDFPRGMCGMENLLRFLDGWLHRQRIGRAVFVGNSLGGHLALLAALRWPERVAGLVLTGSAGLLERGFNLGVPRRPGRDWVRARVEEVFFDPVHATDELLDEVSSLIKDSRTVLNIIRLARAARRANLRDELPHVSCPATLIWGRQDQVTPVEVAHEFARTLPDADLHFIDCCGHAPPIERPAEFNRLLRASLSRFAA
jgi:pimeloyl-ACP methyl ester carboxylesterase